MKRTLKRTRAISRRAFLTEAARSAVGLTLGAGMVSACAPNETVSPTKLPAGTAEVGGEAATAYTTSVPNPTQEPTVDPDVIISPDTKRANRVPPGQRLTDRWPVLHYGAVPRLDPATWTLRIWGLVQKEKTLTLPDFLALPMVKVFSDIHCVTTWSRLDNLWQGVSTEALKDAVGGLLPDARFVIVQAAGNWTTNLTVEDFFQPDVLLATTHDGQAIDAPHGGPVRLVVPRLYFWKSAKWVTGIQFTNRDAPGFWESRGYHNRGDPWTEERYS